MGGSFAALGGKGAARLFTFTDNPISGRKHVPGQGVVIHVLLYLLGYRGRMAGLMVGVLATVLVQSSSTTLAGKFFVAVSFEIEGFFVGPGVGSEGKGPRVWSRRTEPEVG